MEGLFVVSVGSYFYGDQTLRLIFLSLAMHGKRALKSSHQRFKFKYTDDFTFLHLTLCAYTGNRKCISTY